MSIFAKYGPFLFTDNENDMSEEEAQQEEERRQEQLCELIYMYQHYHGIIKEQRYALRGSKLCCQYGTNFARLDCIKDIGILKRTVPALTIINCTTKNIHSFGSCLCPEAYYAGRLPMTVAKSDFMWVPAVKAFDNIFSHICIPLIGREDKWKQIDGDLLAEVNAHGYVPLLTDNAVLVCQYGGIISICEVPNVEEEEILPQDEPIILDGWLTLYSEPTVSADGREVLRHPDAAKYDWAMKEDLEKKAEDWFETESPASKEISSKGDFEVQMTANNLYRDNEGRYWVAVGPCVMDPEYPKEKVKHPIPASKMCYGTKMDIVVMDKEENIYYIPAVVGDAKEHSYPNGLYQTGVPFDKRRPTYTDSNPNTVEFIGREITTKIYDDGNEKPSINITNMYQLIKIIVYDGVYNYE